MNISDPELDNLKSDLTLTYTLPLLQCFARICHITFNLTLNLSIILKVGLMLTSHPDHDSILTSLP